MSYVRNAWYVAAWNEDVKAGKPLALSILDEPIVIWRSERALHALADRCVHRLAPLSLGRCEGAKLRCMYHGLLYDAAGQVVEIPGQEIIPAQARVKSYPVVEKHSWVWVWMGDAARADESLIPPAIGLDHPEFIMGRGQLDYVAEATLINNNLLDFSHLAYVHANSFGASETWAKSSPKITRLDRGIRFERWITDEAGPRRGAETRTLTDGWSSYDFLIPGVLLMATANFPPGFAAACGYGAPDLAKAVSGRTFTSQAVTPLENKKARYFFSWGPHKEHGDAALRDFLMSIAVKAFAEDKVIIEAQQKVMDSTADVAVMPTVHDRGVTMYHLLVEKMARKEAADRSQAA